MFVIRRSKLSDLDVFLKLAKMVHFINLPAEKDIIHEKIMRSRRSFRAVADHKDPHSDRADKSAVGDSALFMFSIEDTSTGNPLGTSMVVSSMGGPGNPNVSFALERKEFFSQDLQQGTSHTVATLYLDESSPSEIGGLILGPSSRRHPMKLGKQLGLVRFHFIGLYREHFADRILAEMMAPVTPDGDNTFWDHLGRRFINMPYDEADRFCQHSREFMLSLMPREPIYITLLSPEARQGVAQVGADTVPARRMLEDLGFAYTGRIDPFDGGPHLEAHTDEIELVRKTAHAELAGVCAEQETTGTGFVSVLDDEGEFRCVYTAFRLDEAAKAITLPEASASALSVKPGAQLGYTPLDLRIAGIQAGQPAVETMS